MILFPKPIKSLIDMATQFNQGNKNSPALWRREKGRILRCGD
jgi:hypothetical protein